MHITTDQQNFMREALKEANKAHEIDEVPIGAVVTLNNEIIGRGFNSVIKQNDPTCHAEIVAIRAAGQYLNNYRLPHAHLYVTLEPCVMCLGAIFHARIEHVFFGASEQKFNSCDEKNNLVNNRLINHQTLFSGGVLSEECGEMLTNFFQKKRST
jgi:tRNA(adenine34) deaminase